jgi:hypothetical protein
MADTSLIDQIANDKTLSTEDKMHLLSQVDPDFPHATTLQHESQSIATERNQEPIASQAAGRESLPRAVVRGGLRGLEMLMSPAALLSETVLGKLGMLPALKPGERPESQEVIGSMSDQFAPPITALGRVTERIAEEVGAGGPFLGAARKTGTVRKLLQDYIAMGAGAGVSKELTPTGIKDIPGGQLASELFGQLGGLSLRRATVSGGQLLAHALPNVRERVAHSAFQERMGQQIGNVEQSRRNIDVAEALQRQFPGYHPTLGQASGDPGLLAVERQARGGNAQLESKVQSQIESSRQALAKGIAGAEEQAPAIPGKASESILSQQQRFDQQAKDLVTHAQNKMGEIEARYTERVQALDPVTREESGQAILQEVHASRNAWKQEANQLYNVGPAASARHKNVNMDYLNTELEKLSGTVDRAEMRDAAGNSISFPSALVNHIRGLSVDKDGNKIAVTLQNLRTLRNVAGQAAAAAKSEVAPDRTLLGRIEAIQGMVEEQFDRALASSVFSVEQVAALQKANDAYRQGIEIFGQDPVVKLFRGGVHGEEAKIPPSAISGMFLHGGKAGVEDARALLSAVGPEKGAALLKQDAMAQVQNLRDTTGKLPPGRFETWLRNSQETLSVVPSVRASFSSLRQAERSLSASEKAVKALPQAIKTPELLQSEAASLYLKQPTRLAIQSMLDKPNSQELLSDTLRMMKDDPVAQMGLRRGVWHELTSRMGLTVPPGTQWTDHVATVAEIMTKHKGTLSTLYTPAQLHQLEQVATGETILNRMPKEQQVRLENIFQKSGVGKFVPPFASRIFAVVSGRTSENFVMAEAASRRIVSALEGLDETKQRAILESTLLSPDLMKTFNHLVAQAGSVPQAKVKFRQLLTTLGLESRSGQDTSRGTYLPTAEEQQQAQP